MALPLADFCEQVEYATKQIEEEKLFQRWIVANQFEQSFSEFKSKLTPPKFKSDKELMADIEKIMDGVTYGNI